MQRSESSRKLVDWMCCAVVMLAWQAWLWFSVCNIDYSAGDAFGGREIAGWFILGQMIAFPIGVGLCAILLWAARHTRRWLVMAAVLAFFAPAVGLSVIESRPGARLRTLLDVRTPIDAKIIRFQQFDSYGDGRTTHAVVEMAPGLAERLFPGLSQQALAEMRRNRLVMTAEQDSELSENLRQYSNDRVRVNYDVDRERLYLESQPRDF